MNGTSTKEYKKLKITGPISVEQVDGIPANTAANVVLIMGPTGSGKSSFIETLGLDHGSKISSNQLEGFTQTVSTYKLNNVVYSNIYLVDSPGFADTKISVMSIVSMIQAWRKSNRNAVFHRILYITPVTHVRIPGSHRQVLKTFQALTGAQTADVITIVTSMWDTVWGGSAKRAERTFNQLQNDIWKDFIDEGAQIVKFYNTQHSTLQIVDDAFNTNDNTTYFHIEFKDNDRPIHTAPFADNISNDLQDRINNLQTELVTLRSDLEYPEVRDDQQLRAVLISRFEEAEKYLAQFQKELYEFRGTPTLEDVKDSAPTSTRSLLRTPSTATSPRDASSASASVPAILSTQEAPVSPHVTNDHPTPGTDTTPNDLPSADRVMDISHSAVPNPIPPAATQIGRLSRALGVITRCGCCGNAVEKNHKD